MPTLPTMTVTDASLWTRLMAAFNADPVAYKSWLRSALIGYLLDFELNQQLDTRRAEINAALNDTTKVN